MDAKRKGGPGIRAVEGREVMVRAWDGPSERTLDGLIEDFIRSQVTGRGLDDRTEKAYRLDLEHFSRWLERDGGAEAETDLGEAALGGADLEQEILRYLRYLAMERKLRTSTISRKGRGFRYFLTYLAQTGQAPGPAAKGSGVSDGRLSFRSSDRMPGISPGGSAEALSKKEIDAFFQAICREMDRLDSDFRRRVCLRDLVMMELLFYHGIEVSELLRLKVTDYDRETGVLTVSRKRGKDRQVYLYSKALRERLGQWLMEHDCFEREGEYREQMFLSKLGRPLSMKMVINIFEKYRELAGIEKAVTPKDLKGSMGAYAKELMREVCG